MKNVLLFNKMQIGVFSEFHICKLRNSPLNLRYWSWRHCLWGKVCYIKDYHNGIMLIRCFTFAFLHWFTPMWRKKIPILHFFFWTNMGRHILEKFLHYSEIQSAIWFANSCSLGVETLLRCKNSEGDWIPRDRYLTKNQQHDFHQDQKRKSLISSLRQEIGVCHRVLLR